MKNNDLLQRWIRDHDRRNDHIPAGLARRALGLAVAMKATVNSIGDGIVDLIPNEDVWWYALRDVPADRFPDHPGSLGWYGKMHASWTVAALRYGTPVLDFNYGSRQSWDFNRRPLSMFQTDAPALDSNLSDLSLAEMFRRDNEKPVRNAELPDAYESVDPVAVPHTTETFVRLSEKLTTWAMGGSTEALANSLPASYLRVLAPGLAGLYDLLTEAKPAEATIHCASCARDVRLSVVKVTKWCPLCRKPHHGNIDQAVPPFISRYTPTPLREAFCRDLIKGLPLKITAPSVYCGPAGDDLYRDHNCLRTQELRDLKLVPHKFKSHGASVFIYLPDGVEVKLNLGEKLEAGHIWTRIVDRADTKPIQNASFHDRWAWAEEFFGHALFQHLHHLWFDSQVRQINPGEFFFPSEFMLGKVAATSEDLFWDFGPMTTKLDIDATIIMPAIPLETFEDLRQTLPFNIVLNASVADPRMLVDYGEFFYSMARAKRAMYAKRSALRILPEEELAAAAM